MAADVVPLPTAVLRDVPAMLREWADAIEAGEHGEVRRCALVLDADGRIKVATAGEGEPAAELHLLLCMGASVVLGRLVKERT